MVDLQSTNRTSLRKIREATFATTPASPALKEVRNTSSSLNANPQTIVSNEIRPDRQVTDLILVATQSGGDIGGELSFNTNDDEFEEALQGTWALKPYIQVVTIDTEISDVSTTTLTVASGLGTPFKTGMLVKTAGFTTAANNKLARVTSSSGTTIVFPASTFAAEAAQIPVNAEVRVVGFDGATSDITATSTGLASTLLDFTTLGISIGEWIKPTNFATAALNAWARVSAVSANAITFDILPSGWTTDAGTGVAIRVLTGDFLTNGSVKRSNTFERQYLDHSPVTYEYFKGQMLNVLQLAMSPQGLIILTKTYLGSTVSVASARLSGATDVAAPTSPVMNTSSDVAEMDMDGVAIAGLSYAGPNFVTGFTININNNLRLQNAIGNLGAVGVGDGEFNVTLSALQTYFGSRAIYDKLLAQTNFGFSTRLQSPSVNKEMYLIDIPALQLATGAPAVSGKNNDVMLDGSAQAVRHATLGYTMGIGRFWYQPS